MEAGTGWPRVQSNTLTSCFSAAPGRISTKFELDTAYKLAFCKLKFHSALWFKIYSCYAELLKISRVDQSSIQSFQELFLSSYLRDQAQIWHTLRNFRLLGPPAEGRGGPIVMRAVFFVTPNWQSAPIWTDRIVKRTRSEWSHMTQLPIGQCSCNILSTLEQNSLIHFQCTKLPILYKVPLSFAKVQSLTCFTSSSVLSALQCFRVPFFSNWESHGSCGINNGQTESEKTKVAQFVQISVILLKNVGIMWKKCL